MPVLAKSPPLPGITTTTTTYIILCCSLLLLTTFVYKLVGKSTLTRIMSSPNTTPSTSFSEEKQPPPSHSYSDQESEMDQQEISQQKPYQQPSKLQTHHTQPPPSPFTSQYVSSPITISPTFTTFPEPTLSLIQPFHPHQNQQKSQTYPQPTHFPPSIPAQESYSSISTANTDYSSTTSLSSSSQYTQANTEIDIAPARRRSYTKPLPNGSGNVTGEIIVAEGWRRHTRVFGGGVCKACEESRSEMRRMGITMVEGGGMGMGIGMEKANGDGSEMTG